MQRRSGSTLSLSEVVVNAVEIAAAPTHVEDTPEPAVAEEVTLTVFKPGEKAKGFRQKTTWESLYAKIAGVRPAQTTNKLDLPGWCAATFTDNHRKLAAVETVSAVVLDFDNTYRPKGAKQTEPLPAESRTTPAAALAVWQDTTAFFYTSWSHSKELPK